MVGRGQLEMEAGRAKTEGASQGGCEEERKCEEEKCLLGNDGNQGRP